MRVPLRHAVFITLNVALGRGFLWTEVLGFCSHTEKTHYMLFARVSVHLNVWPFALCCSSARRYSEFFTCSWETCAASVRRVNGRHPHIVIQSGLKDLCGYTWVLLLLLLLFLSSFSGPMVYLRKRRRNCHVLCFACRVFGMLYQTDKIVLDLYKYFPDRFILYMYVCSRHICMRCTYIWYIQNATEFREHYVYLMWLRASVCTMSVKNAGLEREGNRGVIR